VAKQSRADLERENIELRAQVKILQETVERMMRLGPPPPYAPPPVPGQIIPLTNPFPMHTYTHASVDGNVTAAKIAQGTAGAISGSAPYTSGYFNIEPPDAEERRVCGSGMAYG
jgi:hypothetical protein